MVKQQVAQANLVWQLADLVVVVEQLAEVDEQLVVEVLAWRSEGQLSYNR